LVAWYQDRLHDLLKDLDNYIDIRITITRLPLLSLYLDRWLTYNLPPIFHQKAAGQSITRVSVMPRLYSPSLPGTPILGRTLAIPVPFSRSGRSARIQPRFILLVISICTLLGLVLHPASPAKAVLPTTLGLGAKEDLDLVTEKHDGAWGWFDKGNGKETVLVTGGAGQLGESS
jgi:hypothetical protein